MAVDREPAEAVKHTWTCPACGVRALVDHCESPTCTWHRCQNQVCQLLADLRAGRGTVFDAAGARVPWVRTEPTS